MKKCNKNLKVINTYTTKYVPDKLHTYFLKNLSQKFVPVKQNFYLCNELIFLQNLALKYLMLFPILFYPVFQKFKTMDSLISLFHCQCTEISGNLF